MPESKSDPDETMEVGPDENRCKKCGAPVMYANLNTYGTAFDAEQIVGAGYLLDDDETGQWTACYIRKADREPGELGYRKHDCPAKRLYR